MKIFNKKDFEMFSLLFIYYLNMFLFIEFLCIIPFLNFKSFIAAVIKIYKDICIVYIDNLFIHLVIL